MQDLMQTPPPGDAALELQVSASVAKVQAELQAMMMWAVKFPRNEEVAIEQINNRCKRFTFADAATYQLERKNYQTGEVKIIRGLSIDMAEEVQRRFKNIRIETDVISETESGILLVVSGYDLENNIKLTEPVFVSKLVERSRLYEGQVAISERRNAQGKIVYTVRPSDDDMRAKMLAQTHKAKRNVLLCLVPSDAQEQWIETAFATIEAHSQKEAETDEGRAKIIDTYSKIGVSRKQIESYLGHSFDDLTAEEWVKLRGFYKSITKEGLTWEQATGTDPDRPETERSSIKPEDLRPVETPVDPREEKESGHRRARKTSTGACQAWWETWLAKMREQYKLADRAIDYCYVLMNELPVSDPKMMPDNGLQAFQSWVSTTLVPELQKENWLPQGDIIWE